MNNELRYYLRRLVLTYFNFRYSQYYHLAIPVVLISLGIILLVSFIIPQMNNWFSVQNEVKSTQARINTIRRNTIVLENINKEKIESEFIVANLALPSSKDFSGILDLINDTTNKSGISLDDYEFSLGPVENKDNINKSKSEISTILLSLSIEGDSNALGIFLSEIESQIPLAQIHSVNYSENKGQIQLSFIVKSFDDINFRYDTPLTVMNNKQRSLMQKLITWNAD